MKMVLFLNKINHDHSLLVGNDLAATGWIHGMEKPTKGFTKMISKVWDGSDKQDHLPHISLRKEEWGGLLVHGPTASVYQLDTKACHLIERLKSGESIDSLQKNPAPLTAQEVEEFCNLVKSHGLLSQS